MNEMEELRQDCEQCRGCSLCNTRHNVVFGTGNVKSPVMFIGEGPGEQEDLQGIPFVGAAGMLLNDMLELIDLRRQDVYIANIVKCRPPKNRDPLAEEAQACMPWLEEQRRIVSPLLTICLGRIAAKQIINPDFRITREHGVWYDLPGTRAMAMYHPAALLRDPSKRPETFEDLVKLRTEIRNLCPELYEKKEA